jgi:hypothetical protein
LTEEAIRENKEIKGVIEVDIGITLVECVATPYKGTVLSSRGNLMVIIQVIPKLSQLLMGWEIRC